MSQRYRMSKKEKLENKLRTIPADFKWNDLVTVLERRGFKRIDDKGSSHRTFYHEESQILIDNLVRPHPSNTVKRYILRKVVTAIEELELYQNGTDEI
jgi:predicted RNA binding protein YcfA (HicA-like mRNA interferase family)